MHPESLLHERISTIIADNTTFNTPFKAKKKKRNIQPENAESTLVCAVETSMACSVARQRGCNFHRNFMENPLTGITGTYPWNKSTHSPVVGMRRLEVFPPAMVIVMSTAARALATKRPRGRMMLVGFMLVGLDWGVV